MKILCASLLLTLISLLGFDQYFPHESNRIVPVISEQQKMKGLNFVAPPRPFDNNPMLEVKQVNANWIAIVPIAYTRLGQPAVRYNVSTWQWWGERPEGVQKTVELAREANINIMLKPQVYIPGSWPGGLDFDTEEEWEKWEEEYTQYIMGFVEMAERNKIKLFCIGTEFKIAVRKREAFWRALIAKVRAKYSGQLTYAANWDSFTGIPIWDALDYAGIDAYFPLVDTKTPSVDQLKEAWKPSLKKIRDFHKKVNKPILFTEYGYLSVDGCAGKTWELESKIPQLSINEQAQANALDALYETFWEEPYWKGGFIWKWFPNMEGGEGYNAKDYTPQGKLANRVMSYWYAKTN